MEGEGAPGRQRPGRVPHPMAEQRPEVEGRSCSHCFGRVCGERRNGEGATVAVMRCGCQRGDFFEGCEGRRGKARPVLRSSVSSEASGSRSPGAAETRRTPSGTGMQQARNFASGETRRGGEKPRGRNTTSWMVSRGPKPAATSVGVDARGACRRRGTTRANLTRGGSTDRAQARFYGPGRFRALLAKQGHEGPTRRGTPWGPTRRRGKVERGAAKTHELLPGADGSHRIRKGADFRIP
jgi:hypothetical protein